MAYDLIKWLPGIQVFDGFFGYAAFCGIRRGRWPHLNIRIF